MNHTMAWQHSCLVWQAEEQALIEEHLFLQMHSLKVKSGLLKLMDLLIHVKTAGWNYQFSIGHWDQTQIQKEWDSKEVELLAQSLSLFSLKSELMPEGWKVASAVSIFKYRCERRWRNYRLASLTSIAEKIREKKPLKTELQCLQMLGTNQHGGCHGKSLCFSIYFNAFPNVNKNNGYLWRSRGDLFRFSKDFLRKALTRSY